MNSFQKYLPILYSFTQGKLLVYLQNHALHIDLITHRKEIYRHIIHDIETFKEDVGYAFSDKFTVVCLNSLKDLKLDIRSEKAIIVFILAKRECTITLDAIDHSKCIDIIGLMGVTNKIPDLPPDVAMGPPALPKLTPKRKRNQNVLQFRRKRKAMSLSRALKTEKKSLEKK